MACGGIELILYAANGKASVCVTIKHIHTIVAVVYGQIVDITIIIRITPPHSVEVDIAKAIVNCRAEYFHLWRQAHISVYQRRNVEVEPAYRCV